jgi:dihydroxy-acid dehydratase
MTVTGRTLRENLTDTVVRDPEVIRPLSRPCSDKPSIVILRGSLAPESAVVKLGLRGPERRAKQSGPAIVFENGSAAIEAIRAGRIKPGHVLVVRGMGLKGGPGMAGPASMVVFALDGAGLTQEVAFVTDGQLSGLCNKGLTVADVSPEAAVGGPIGLVEDGDLVTIDVDRQCLALEVAESELAQRSARRAPAVPRATGYLSIYQRSVQPMSTGAVLVEPQAPGHE